jgi:putative membrane protein
MALGLVTVLGAASAAKADLPEGTGDVPRSALAPTDYSIVKSLHGMSTLGVTAGQIAQKNGSTQAVRDFGTTLVQTHTSGDQQLVAYAKNAGIDPNRMKNEPPPQELAYYLQSVDHLRTLKGKEFDLEFTRTVREAYGETIKQIQTAQPNIADSKLNALLNQRLPILEQNYQTAASLAAQSAAALSNQHPAPLPSPNRIP